MAEKLSSDVEIELDGETHLLRANLKNATAISRHFGGFDNALGALIASNLDAYQFIVKNSIVTDKNVSTETLREMVWRRGMKNLSGELSKLISMCRNGGRDPDEEDDDKSSIETAGNGHEG